MVAWLVTGIFIGVLAMSSGGTVMAQKPAPHVAAATQYVTVDGTNALNQMNSNGVAQILNQESQQGFSYVGMAGNYLIFKK
jgi:hypothetical protein